MDIQNNVNEDVVVGAPEQPVIVEVPPVEFSMHIEQKFDNKKGEPQHFDYRITFTLPNDVANAVDYVIGTALDVLFRKMDKAKAMGNKLFSAVHPIDVTISSTFLTLELGKIEQQDLQKLKVNSSARSQLNFVKRITAVVSDLLTPLSVKRATELFGELKESLRIQGKDVSKLHLGYNQIAVSNMVIEEPVEEKVEA